MHHVVRARASLDHAELRTISLAISVEYDGVAF